MIPLRLAGLLLLAAALTACASAPVTGRSQFMLVSEGDAISASTQAYTEVLKKEAGKIDHGSALERRVEEITGRLVAQAVKFRPETAQWKWEVVVIDEPDTLNAWAMAGGKMAIYTGIIQKLNLSDDEIAQIMGHEIAHALAKHTAERMSVAVAQQLGLQVASTFLGTGSLTSQMAMQAAAIATTVGVQLPNSRKQESEADRIGLILMAMAGYDPREAVTVWEQMRAANTGPHKAEWLSTHPADTTRIADIRHWLPEAMRYYRPQ